MAHFTADFRRFFDELEKHNDKAWFDTQRKRYGQTVKKPFEAFVAELIARLRAEDPSIAIEPKDAIFRINRDIRFSRDKAPYKTNASAVISMTGKKDKGCPGLYLELSHQGVQLMGGAYLIEPARLERLRRHVGARSAELRKALGAPAFRKRYGELLGEKSKRLPADLKSAAESEPYVFHKQFYYGCKLPPKVIETDGLPDEVVAAFEDAEPVRRFLLAGLGY